MSAIIERIRQANKNKKGVRLRAEETAYILSYIDAVKDIDSGCNGCIRDTGEKIKSQPPCNDCCRNYGDRKDESDENT